LLVGWRVYRALSMVPSVHSAALLAMTKPKERPILAIKTSMARTGKLL
jgi:hypothetical protein